MEKHIVNSKKFNMFKLILNHILVQENLSLKTFILSKMLHCVSKKLNFQKFKRFLLNRNLLDVFKIYIFDVYCVQISNR